MHKNACGAILADRPDRGHLVDPLTAAEIEALGADNDGKDAGIEDLGADKSARPPGSRPSSARTRTPSIPPPLLQRAC